MSGHRGWDDQASWELSTAALLLDGKGDAEHVNELIVHALATAIRVGFKAAPTDDDELQGDDPLVRTIVELARWLAEGDDSELRLGQVIEGLGRVADAQTAQGVEQLTRIALRALEHGHAQPARLVNA